MFAVSQIRAQAGLSAQGYLHSFFWLRSSVVSVLILQALHNLQDGILEHRIAGETRALVQGPEVWSDVGSYSMS